jgi:hypothetical protein
MTYCQWCPNEFESLDSRQIYCSPECRTQAAKSKSAAKALIEKRRKRVAKPKKCAGGCGTILSIYNESKICDNCLVHKKRVDEFTRDLKKYFDVE